MRLLIIGGTRFVGPALVEAALANGRQVTLFNRGVSRSDFNADVETIIGDRESDLDKLAGRRWDAVIDTCGYLPRLVQLSAQALRDTVGHYTFISTLSVYPTLGGANRDETAEVLTLADDTVEEVNGETYGPLKVLCEAAAQGAFPGACLVIRAGLIAGPRDQSDRFTYWVRRAAKGGPAIAPPAAQPVQFIDVRDLAAFTLRQVAARKAGIFNLTGPAEPMTFAELLARAREALKSDVNFHYASDSFLQENDVAEFTGLPLWLSQATADSFMTFNIDRALRAGLTLRDPAQTVQATWQWARAQPQDAPKAAGIPPEKEAALLKVLARVDAE